MSRTNQLILATLLTIATLEGCERSGEREPDRSPQTGNASKPQAYVVNYPLKYFAQRIAGDAADVVFPAPPDVDPAFWNPAPDVIASYQRADLILRNGASYARWIDRTTLPFSKVVDTSIGFRDQYISQENTVRHAHGPEGQHAHTGTAFTTWLDPSLAEKQATAIRDSLLKLLPERAEDLNGNFNGLANDLQALDARLRTITQGHESLPLLASHPVYQYLARRYQLNLKSVLWEPDEVPSERQWSELEQVLREHPAKWMIWEASPKAEIAEALRQRGIGCIVFFPCGNVPPDDGDFLQAMTNNTERLPQALDSDGG